MLRASARALRVGACICCPHKSAVRLAATTTAHRAGQLVSRAQSHPNGSTLGRGLLVACSEPTDTGCLRLMRWRALQLSWFTNGRARSSVATAANSCALGCVHAPARDFLWAYHKVAAMLWELGAALFCPKELRLDTLEGGCHKRRAEAERHQQAEARHSGIENPRNSTGCNSRRGGKRANRAKSFRPSQR